MQKYKTALIGFGKIASGYARDTQMAKAFKYATHVQVLAGHPQFSLEVVIDPNEVALKEAKNNWGVLNAVTSAESFKYKDEIDVLILATPPEIRKQVIDSFPNLKGLMVEKPLATNFTSAKTFVADLGKKNLVVQVNLMRRADEVTRQLAEGLLEREIGKPQAVFVVYGNGLLNNGTHMIDLSRFFFGEVESVQCVDSMSAFKEGPISEDINFPFYLKMRSGLIVNFQPLKFSCYRENAMTIWGEGGRLEYLHGGATILKSGLSPNRIISDSLEVSCDISTKIESTLGESIYNMYSNLASCIVGEAELFSPLTSALRTAQVVDALFQSFSNDNRVVAIDA